MNELNLGSIILRKKPCYVNGTAHKIFPNLLNREFNVKEPNKIWCTDFTYLIRPNGTMRYNCTIINLCWREAIATLNSNHIDTKLAKETLGIALKRRKPAKGIILHSDQGRQFTSLRFTQFCKKNPVRPHRTNGGLTPYAARCRVT